MAKAYLTIDDSPSTRMDDLVDFLSSKNIPALFFCRGDELEKNPVAVIRAIQQGMVIGNHGYSHARASQISVQDMIDEIDRTQKLIDNIYDMANFEKPGNFFRFPHMDRGCGSQILDFEAFDIKERNIVKAIFTEGLNTISNKKLSDDEIKKKNDLQKFLKDRGYKTPFPDVNLPWYKNSAEIQNAADCFFTFSSADWMLTQRHLGKWRYQSYDDLSQKITADQWLLKQNNTSIILMHDQSEIMDTVLDLLTFLDRCDLEFLEIK
ncbi:MAG: polysaccharide deacetylase family protein [Pseudomonadota bacterium]